MQPLVSICIPTYNRAECLVKTIESIICQPEFKSGEVEIVISDNASSDNTQEVCEKYKHFKNFLYFRNEDNVRDRNFPIVLGRANGKLRKLNNDTFVLLDGSLKKLCDLVRKYDETRQVIFIENQGKETRNHDFHGFVMDVSFWITWIASHTFWDDDCVDIANDFSGCELSLWQVKKTLEIASNKNNVVIFGDKVGESITPPKKDISYGLYKVFYENYFHLLEPYVKEGSISSNDKEELERDLLFSFFMDWVARYELANTDMQYSKEENLKLAVAAFFATHRYDRVTNSYSLIREGIGRIRRMWRMPLFPEEDFIRPIGVQPFCRPSNQYGYGCWIKENEDLADMMQIIEFEQDYKVNLRLKTSMTGPEMMYFPNEKIVQMANVIKNENVITNAAIDLMSTGGFINPVPAREEIVEVLKKAGTYIVDAPVICPEAIPGIGQCLSVKPRIVLKPVYGRVSSNGKGQVNMADK